MLHQIIRHLIVKTNEVLKIEKSQQDPNQLRTCRCNRRTLL